jgi:hypothetical protein
MSLTYYLPKKYYSRPFALFVVKKNGHEKQECDNVTLPIFSIDTSVNLM